MVTSVLEKILIAGLYFLLLRSSHHLAKLLNLKKSDYWLGLFTIFFSLYVNCFFIAGLFGLFNIKALTPLNLFILALSCYLILLAASKKKKKYLTFRSKTWPVESIKKNWPYLASLLSLYSFLIFMYSHQYPSDYDGISYRLPIILNWLKQNTMNIVGNFSMSSTLGNFETYLYSLFQFGGEKFVNIGEIPFTLMSTLALYLIARKLSFDKKSSFVAACIFITMPIVLIQSTTIMSDMFGCAFLLMAEIGRAHV